MYSGTWEDACPRDRKSISVHAHVLHELYIFLQSPFFIILIKTNYLRFFWKCILIQMFVNSINQGYLVTVVLINSNISVAKISDFTKSVGECVPYRWTSSFFLYCSLVLHQLLISVILFLITRLGPLLCSFSFWVFSKH